MFFRRAKKINDIIRPVLWLSLPRVFALFRATRGSCFRAIRSPFRGIHLLQHCFIWTAAELFPVEFFEGIDFRDVGDRFVHQQRLHIAPPLVIRRAQLGHHCGVFVEDIFRFAGIGLEIIQFFVVNQRELRVLDRRIGILGITRLAMSPAAHMMNQVAISPLGIGIFQQWQQAPAFDLLLHFLRQLRAGDVG